MSVGFRPVAPGDEPLLLALYASTRAVELAQVPWSEEQKHSFIQLQFVAQSQHYQAYYPHSEHVIILKEQAPVGRLWVDRGPDEIHVLDLIVLPERQRQGIGGAVLAGLTAEGAASGRPVSIYLDSWSPVAPLFARLGFTQVSENGHQYLLQWTPAPAQLNSHSEEGLSS
jgi:GNAT superfamily N-acetyltransferase